MDKVEEAVNSLGLSPYGEFNGNNFVAEFTDSDIFSNFFMTISEKYDSDENSGEFNDENSMVVFTDEDIEIITTANYDNDKYSISIGVK